MRTGACNTDSHEIGSYGMGHAAARIAEVLDPNGRPHRSADGHLRPSIDRGWGR
jgi:hypothetical protein